MAALPPSTDFTGAAVTEAGFKTAITGLRDYLSGLFGTDGVAGTARDTVGAYERNRLYNPGWAVAQRGATPTTTDNTYCLDGARALLEAASACAVAQDTADTPSGAKYAAKLTVGSGNNNKFGLFMPVEGKDMWDLRGGKMSVRVALKATAGLTDGAGKIRIGVCQWTGTEDAISADPVTTWGAEGTNPTLSGSWAFANTPAALSVTTSWVEYTVENVSISASATNLALMIWSDDKTNTQTTDILRVGPVMFHGGTKARAWTPRAIEEDLRACQRYLVAYDADGTTTGINFPAYCANTTSGNFVVGFPTKMRIAPTGCTVSSASHFEVASSTSTACSAVTFNSAGTRTALVGFTVTGQVANTGAVFRSSSTSGQLLFTGAEL
jgi:hypothetical protein